MDPGAQLLSPFYSAQEPTYRTVLPTLRVSLSWCSAGVLHFIQPRIPTYRGELPTLRLSLSFYLVLPRNSPADVSTGLSSR